VKSVLGQQDFIGGSTVNKSYAGQEKVNALNTSGWRPRLVQLLDEHRILQRPSL
jgi:hypothetical protein